MSSLTTITFGTLRDRNNAALDRTGYTPDGDFQQLTAPNRRLVQTLLTQRAGLEDLASTQQQREAYGIEQWHDDFVRLKDISPSNNQRVDEWDALRNSRFKRFQQAFSHAHQFISPPFVIDDPRINFIGPPNFNTMSLAPCLVSADKIPSSYKKIITAYCVSKMMMQT